MQRPLVSLVLGTAVLMGVGVAGLATAEDAQTIEQGRQIAFDVLKGNCLACHEMAGGDSPGNIGPPLVAMEARFPDKSRLRAQIWDPTATNPSSIMPPFGLHGILSEDEIDKVVEFVYSL